MDPKNPRWMTTEERRARSARMWKIIVSALSGAALATMIVASCLDRDDEAKLDEPGVTQTTAAEAPAGGASDTSSGLAGGGGAAGVPADQPLGGGAPPDTNTGLDPTNANNPGSADTSTGAPMSRAPVTLERVDNVTINVTTNGAPSANGQPAGAAPVAGHAAHQDNDPNALVQRGLNNSAAGVPTATSNDAGVPPVSNWSAAGPPIMMGIPPQGGTTTNPQNGSPLQSGQGITGGTPPAAPAVPTVTAIPPSTAPTAPAPTVTATPTVAPNTPGAPVPPAPR